MIDREGSCLPLAPGSDVWTLLALSHGAEVDLFGEWEDGVLHPCAVQVEDRLVAL